jgi:hypothetical protein
MRALAAARSSLADKPRSSSAAIQRETLTPAWAALMRTRRSVASSMLMVTFFITRSS